MMLSLHSPNEPSELWHWPCHEDSTAKTLSLVFLLYYHKVKVTDVIVMMTAAC